MKGGVKGQGHNDVFRLFTLTLLLTSLPLARHNLRTGRGVREGAWRVGGLVFGCEAVAFVAGAHHTGTFAAETVAGAIVFVVRGDLCLFLLLQLVLRACGRVPGLGAAAFFAIAFGLTLANMRAMGVAGPLLVFVSVTSGVAWAFLILRFGILAMIANLLMRALLLAVPSTSVLTGWIAPSSWCFIGISALLTVYGLYYATAGRPFGRWKPLEL